MELMSEAGACFGDNVSHSCRATCRVWAVHFQSCWSFTAAACQKPLWLAPPGQGVSRDGSPAPEHGDRGQVTNTLLRACGSDEPGAEGVQPAVPRLPVSGGAGSTGVGK